MPHGSYAQCPNCGVVAHGDDEIEKIFGFRYGHTKPQSWCKECRSTGNDSAERISVSDAANIWLSSGMDEDNTFGYTEEELRDALR